MLCAVSAVSCSDKEGEEVRHYFIQQAVTTPPNYKLTTECVVDPNDGYLSWIETNFPQFTTGYDETRILIQAQAWWFPTPEDGGGIADGQSHGHQHLTTCIPAWDTEITGNGTIPFHLLVNIHLDDGVPSTLKSAMPTDIVVGVPKIELRGVEDGGGDLLIDQFTNFPDQSTKLQCSYGESCTFKFQFHGAYQASAVTCVEDNPTQTTCTGPKFKIKGSSRIGDQPGFTKDGIKQLRIAAISSVRAPSSTVKAQMRAIIRHPLRIDLDGNTQYVDSNRKELEAVGWWVNKDNPDPPNEAGAGGYAAVKIDWTNGWPDIASLIDPVVPGTSFTLPGPMRIKADPCISQCKADNREMSGFRIYVNPEFHKTTFYEFGNSLKKYVCFKHDTPGTIECVDRRESPNFPSATSVATEEDGVGGGADYTLTNGQRTFTLPPLCSESKVQGCMMGGLNRIVVLGRQPMQRTNDSQVPAEDRSTLTGGFVLYVVVEES